MTTSAPETPTSAFAGHSKRPGDRIFAGAAIGAGVLILALLAGVALFLIVKGWPAVTADASELPGGDSLVSYICAAGLRDGSVGRHRDRHRRAARGVGVAVHRLLRARAARRRGSATSSICSPPSRASSTGCGVSRSSARRPCGLQQWLADNLGFLPFFEGPASATGRTMLVVGFVLALMILPIISAITREVFARTPAFSDRGRAWRSAPRDGR